MVKILDLEVADQDSYSKTNSNSDVTEPLPPPDTDNSDLKYQSIEQLLRQREDLFAKRLNLKPLYIHSTTAEEKKNLIDQWERSVEREGEIVNVVNERIEEGWTSLDEKMERMQQHL